MSGLLPAAALFDMDGLLVDTESLWYVAETDLMVSLGVPWGPDHAAALVGGPLSRAIAYMVEHAGGDHSPDDLLADLVTRMELLLRTEPVHWRPGARRLLGDLHRSGVPCALVSASPRNLVDAVLDAVLHEVGDGAFVTTVASDEGTRTKPFPDPYLLAARRLGVDAREAVVLEDSPTGVAAGRAAGALVVAVPHVVPIEAGDGVRVVASLDDLTPELLGQWSRDWAACA